jgi:drug/metabolite transporter (DMT)-like permease
MTTAVARRTEVGALAAALLTVTLWGSAFVAIRDAGRTFSPGSLALGRLLVSLLALGAVASIRREPMPERREVVRIAAFGVLFLGVYSVALNAAERRVDAGTAAMLINTGPILIATLAGVFLREGFPRWLFAGCAVAFAGCVLIGLANTQAGSGAGLGIALLIVAACAYASAVVIQKSVLARVSPLQVTVLGCAAATVVCLPFSPTLIRELDGPAAVGWIAGRALAGAAATLALIVAMGGLTLIDFERLFLAFHLVSFDNDLWQLDPRRDNLIRFFPFEFWFDATVTVALRTVFFAVVLAVAAWTVRRWEVRKAT